MEGNQRAAFLNVNGMYAFNNTALATQDNSPKDVLTQSGGALYVQGAAIAFENAHFHSNTASYGGGLYWALVELPLAHHQLFTLEIATNDGLQALLVCPSLV